MIEIRHKDTGVVLLRVDAGTLEEANLAGRDLDGADLSGQGLWRANFRGANLDRAQLEGATLADASLAGANLAEANLKRARMGGTNLRGATLDRADLEGAVLVSGFLEGASFRGANLRETNLSFSHMTGTVLIEANLENAKLIDTNLRGAHLEGANLHGADLSSQHSGVEGWTIPVPRLAGAAYNEATRWPAGFDPRQHGAVRVGEPRRVAPKRYPPIDPSLLADRNLETWRQIVALYEGCLQRPGGDWLLPVLQLVQHLAASDRARLFRAGQSLETLIISTKAEHGLEPGDSWVWVTFDRQRRFQMSYVRGGTHNQEKHVCAESEILPALTPLLDRLWSDTRG